MPRRRPQGNELDISALRVAKTIRHDQHGAKRHSARHGPDLICVRHRVDTVARIRYVTVELVVDVLPVALRETQEVAVQMGTTDRETRVMLMSCKARWDPRHKVWRMPRSVARTLRVLHRIVPNPG
jgi:hypothetical protein